MSDSRFEGINLPAGVLELVEFAPIEDIVLAVLRDGLPDIPTVSMIADEPPPMFLLVRRINAFGIWRGDPRFLDSGRFFVHAFTSDPDGDEKGALLSEAVRVVLRNAWLQRKVIPDLGSISNLTVISEPTRKTDWATATGPVQFADLPNGMNRYEAVYHIDVRKPITRS